MNKIYLLIGLLFCIPMVSANLIITPVNSDVSVYRGQQSIFALSVTNNNTFRIYNVSFTQPNAFFGMPSIDSLDPGATVQVPFSVKTDTLFSVQVYVSTVSFFYSTEYNLTPKNYFINVSDSGYSPANLTIMQNDTVTWNNVGSNATQVKDLGSGFTSLLVPYLGNVVQTYPSLASYTFYNFPGTGFTGSLNVIERSNVVLAHDSTLDVPITFTVHSSLNPSTLQFTNVLPFNFSSNNNQTQYGIVEVKNFDNQPLYNVILSDSRGWINFSQNNFTLNALENRLVNFNITPLVFHTNETNVSLPITLFARSVNGGNGSITVSMVIAYQNLDTMNINGTQYVVNFLSVNDTIAACKQHRQGVGVYDPGFESCILLEIPVNQTIIQEVPAMVTVTESQAKAGWQSIVDVKDGFQRVENLYNRLYDGMQLAIELGQNNSRAELARDERQQAYEEMNDRRYHNLWTLLIILISAYFIFKIVKLLSWIAECNEEFRLRVETLQE